MCLSGSAGADVAVPTQHNNLYRTGANLGEMVLTVTNVNTSSFGLVFTRAVDDQIYAQPLIATNVNLGTNGTHNLIIIATVKDSIYAFDADNPAATNAYWFRTFLGTNILPVNNSDLVAAGNPCGAAFANITGNIGIIGTPVIDPASGILYVVARTKETSVAGTNSVTNFVQRIHALNITNGAEQSYSPVVINFSVPGTNYYDGTTNNYDSTNGLVVFNNLQQNQRPGLALVNGCVYVCWGSHCDYDPYHGWMAGYSETNLQLDYLYNTSPNGQEGALWMSGQAPAADAAGNLYISVANGTVGLGGTNANLFPSNVIARGNSFLKLTPSGTNLSIASWFTPYNYAVMNQNDWDLGSAGILLIPNTSLAFSGGKQGILYLINRDNMGGVSASSANTNILQSWSIADSSGNEKIYGSPVWWDGPNGSYAYVWAGFNDPLRQYPFNRTNQLFNIGALITSTATSPNGHPGGILSVSANGTNAGTGIVWASLPNNPTVDAEHATVVGILRAYNATNVAQELWDSQQLPSRDAVPSFAKFVPPTVANGKVYLATFSGELLVYGLLTPPKMSVSPGSLEFGTVSTGRTNALNFQVMNIGGSNLTGTVTINPPFTIQGGSPFSIPSGTTGLVQVGIYSTNTGNYSNNIIFTSNGGSATNAVTAVVIPPVVINLSITNNRVQITWPQGTLQSAAQVTGPYTDTTNGSPYFVTPSNAMQFYRVRVN